MPKLDATTTPRQAKRKQARQAVSTYRQAVRNYRESATLATVKALLDAIIPIMNYLILTALNETTDD